MREHLFYGISPDDCFCQISSWRAFPKKKKKKIPMKTLLKKSCFIMTETLDLKIIKTQSYRVKTSDLYSLYAENYLINRNSSQWQILRIFWKCFRDTWLLLIKKNENFSNKENCFVLDRSFWVFFIRAQNYSIF